MNSKIAQLNAKSGLTLTPPLIKARRGSVTEMHALSPEILMKKRLEMINDVEKYKKYEKK